MDTITLAHPLWLIALLLLFLVAWFRGQRAVSAIIMPFSGAWRRPTFGSGSKLAITFAYLATILIIIALARPQKVETERHTKSKGYDIVLAIDLSGSMYSEDYKDGSKRINRLQAVKPVLNAFIEERKNDRIGLIAFAGKAYTIAPLTFDHEWLARQTDRLEIGLIEDGTALGDALAVSVSRLLEGSKQRAGEREGAFAALLTDGENTAGLMEPLDAAQLGKDNSIPIFTIGAGRQGRVPFPVFDESGNRVSTRYVNSTMDERTLQQIADLTDGAYFRAESSDTIESAFEEIDKRNKVEFEVNQYSTTTELFPYFLYAAAACFAVALLATASLRKEVLV